MEPNDRPDARPPAIRGRIPNRIAAGDSGDSGGADWKYVDVRRLLIYLEHSIDEGLQWSVFEPNDEPLWAAVRRTVSDFLVSEWRDGALVGQKAEEAFFVRCDRTTMTQGDIDSGRLNVVIGVAPVRPAEFVIFQIGQWTAVDSLGGCST